MKLRIDFVSNSSSSSFIFVFKKEDMESIGELTDAVASLIGKNVYYDEYNNASAMNVAEDLMNAYGNDLETFSLDYASEGNVNRETLGLAIKDIAEGIPDLECSVQTAVEDIKEDRYGSLDDEKYYREQIRHAIGLIDVFMMLISYIGDTHVMIVIEYGDNDGRTGSVGMAMDYEIPKGFKVKEGRLMYVESCH